MQLQWQPQIQGMLPHTLGSSWGGWAGHQCYGVGMDVSNEVKHLPHSCHALPSQNNYMLLCTGKNAQMQLLKSVKMPKRREADGHSEYRGGQGVSSRCKVLHGTLHRQQPGTLPAPLQNPGHSHPWLMTQKLQVTSIQQSVRGRGGQKDEMP